MGMLYPAHQMMLCQVSKALYSVIWTFDLKYRNINEEIIRAHDPMQQRITISGLSQHMLRTAAAVGNMHIICDIDAYDLVVAYCDTMAESAIMHHQIEVLRMLYSGCRVKNYIAAACARTSNLAMIDLTIELVPGSIGYMCATAAVAHNLPVLKHLHDKGLLSDVPDTARYANDECAEWFIEMFPDMWERMHKNAAHHNNLCILNHLHAAGYRHQKLPRTGCEVIKWYHMNGYTLRLPYRMMIDGFSNDEDTKACIIWAVAQGLGMSPTEIYLIINKFGIQWIISNNIVSPPRLSKQVIMMSRLPDLKVLHENGYPINIIDAIDVLISCGNLIGGFTEQLSVFQWVVGLGLALSPDLYIYCVRNRVDFLTGTMVRVLYDNGCPLSAEVFRVLFRHNYDPVGITRQLIELKCPWDSSVCLMANRYTSIGIIDIIHQGGCPCCSTCCWAHTRTY